MLKIVLDSNILVSAFLAPKGEDAQVLRQAQEHKLYLSPFILSEVWRVLHYSRIRAKYPYPDDAIERHLRNLTLVGRLFEPSRNLGVCRDPNDNAILACAVEAQADYLVTRNLKDFPELFESVSVIHPKQFLRIE